MTQLRAVIYARYSSDLQREESIADQIEVCRRYAEAQGWSIVEYYSDAAISGSSRFRPAFQKLLHDAELRNFDIVVCEALDRWGRRLADTADLQDQLSFLKIRLFTPALGEVTPIHVAVMGMMAQMALKDLGDKTKRGQLGRVLKGRIPAGIAYGYKAVSDQAGGGGREINELEARIVRRIFAEYALGKTPEAIARDLNAEKVLGPRGRPWSNTTIRGQADRGTGVLNNALYRGILEWNRCSYIKNPKTGRRVARPNPENVRETVEVANLRIIDEALWQRTKDRQGKIRVAILPKPSLASEPANLLNGARRHRFLLSGILRCGCCTGPYSISGKDRFSCSNRKQKGTCDNAITITRQDIEGRVLSGLKERLLAPDLVEAYIKAFHDEVKQQRQESQKSRSQMEKHLAEIDRKTAAIMRAIEDGLYEPSMKERIAVLNEEKLRLKSRAITLPETDVSVLTHPKLAEIYGRKVAQLENLLEGPDHLAATELIRSMIQSVTLTPRPDRSGLDAILAGDLATILNICLGAQEKSKLPNSKAVGSQLSVVAGGRYHLDRTVVFLGGRLSQKPVTATDFV